MSWCFKKQLIVALASIKIESIALNLAAKEATCLCLLLMELGLLQLDQKHATIKVSKYNTSTHAIQNNLDKNNLEITYGGGEIIIPWKYNNQGSINSDGSQTCLLLKNQVYWYTAPLYLWWDSLKENQILLYHNQSDNCKRPYKSLDLRQILSLHQINEYDLE